ncbi:MAG: hypothetical protein IJ731_00250 [Eubacterium sp.]|nr:hypothetical protein [Eubacterium sp.]
MIFTIVISLILAIACIAVAAFFEVYFFLVFAVAFLVVFAITYSKYNRRKHPEEYKKTNNFNPNARLVANGSKAGTIITVCVLIAFVILAVIYFLYEVAGLVSL